MDSCQYPLASTKGLLLPVISNQKTNKYLKEIMEICDVKKMVTFHTARHTFGTTVTLNNDVRLESISKMMGHRKITTTQIYARLLDKTLAQDMAKLFRNLERG